MERAIVIALTRGEAFGLELINRVASSSGGRVNLTQGNVYPLLRQLEDEGFVVGRDDGGTREAGGKPRRFYDLTDSGRGAARSDLDALERFTMEHAAVSVQCAYAVINTNPRLLAQLLNCSSQRVIVDSVAIAVEDEARRLGTLTLWQGRELVEPQDSFKIPIDPAPLLLRGYRLLGIYFKDRLGNSYTGSVGAALLDWTLATQGEPLHY